jgi:hypothetical protein
MPCDIILLILSFICYNFVRLERVNPLQPKKIVVCEEQNEKYDTKWHHGTGKCLTIIDMCEAQVAEVDR